MTADLDTLLTALVRVDRRPRHPGRAAPAGPAQAAVRCHPATARHLPADGAALRVGRHGNLAGIRQWIESVNDTLKGELDLERHGARTEAGVFARVAQRLLALAAAIWHNWRINAPDKRSLIAYDH